mgnify:CR=1 FL=1
MGCQQQRFSDGHPPLCKRVPTPSPTSRPGSLVVICSINPDPKPAQLQTLAWSAGKLVLLFVLQTDCKLIQHDASARLRTAGTWCTNTLDSPMSLATARNSTSCFNNRATQASHNSRLRRAVHLLGTNIISRVAAQYQRPHNVSHHTQRPPAYIQKRSRSLALHWCHLPPYTKTRCAKRPQIHSNIYMVVGQRSLP